MTSVNDISAHIANELDKLPPETIVARWLDGKPPRTAREMAASVRAGNEDGQTFVKELISVAVDMLRRKAKRGR